MLKDVKSLTHQARTSLPVFKAFLPIQHVELVAESFGERNH